MTRTYKALLPILGALVSGEIAADSPKQNYERFCAACHGFNGMSVAPGAPNLRLNEGMMQSDSQIVEKLKAGSAKKPPMIGMLSDQDLYKVVAYSRTLR